MALQLQQMKDRWVRTEGRDTECGKRKMEDFRIETEILIKLLGQRKI